MGGRSAGQSDRRRKAIHQHVVPLVENGDSPITIRQARESERAIGGALGECKILAVRVSKAHVALGESEAIVRAAAVESLVRGAAHTLGRDGARHSIGAVRAGDGGVAASADARQAIIDDLRVGKADGHVESRRSKLLEEARLADAEERIVRLLSVQRIGLQPLFTSGNPVGRRRRENAISAGVQVSNDRLARQG